MHVVLIEIIFERSGVSEDLRIPYLLKSQVPNFPNSRQLELSSLSDIWICISASLSFGQTPHSNANRCQGGGKHSQRSFTDRFVTYMIELIIWKLVWKVYNNQNQLCEISQFWGANFGFGAKSFSFAPVFQDSENFFLYVVQRNIPKKNSKEW